MWKKLSKQFEQLSEFALRRYLHGSTINIGFPRGPPLPRSFRDCLNHISSAVGESPVRLEHLKYSGPSAKDRGADVVGWIPFEDCSPGQIVLLINCAAGEDWNKKRGELPLHYWRKIIDWHIDPMQGFSIPFVHQREEEWRGLSADAGIVFDTMRISALFDPARRGKAKDTLAKELKQSCQIMIARLPRWDLSR
jgi:hypothetical protein